MIDTFHVLLALTGGWADVFNRLTQMGVLLTDLQQASQKATGKAWPQDMQMEVGSELKAAVETLYDSLPVSAQICRANIILTR